MLSPTRHGGFGMINVKELMNSLDLRSYGRLLVTKHPFLSQLKNLINARNFFNLEVDVVVDDKLKNSIKLLNGDRKLILRWPNKVISKDVNLHLIVLSLKVSDLLTPNGKRSLQFFAIHGRNRGARFNQITLVEYGTIERFIIYPELRAILRRLLSIVHLPNLHHGLTALDAYPTGANALKKISTLSSKQFRQDRSNSEDTMQCVYKLGLIMTPGEVIS